jgi:predicted DNA-binding protein with PD1-like motif
MEYRRFENVIIARIDRGEEILSKIKEIALKEDIKLANINALGATDHFVIGVYNVDEQKYYSNEFKGAYEIVP